MAVQTAVAATPAADEVPAHVADIETRLGGLETAFASGDAVLIEQRAIELQRSLADSLVAFRKAAQAGVDPLNEATRARLKLAQARIQAQQLAVHRATASIDRTLAILFPRDENAQGGTYGGLAQSAAAKALGKAYR